MSYLEREFSPAIKIVSVLTLKIMEGKVKGRKKRKWIEDVMKNRYIGQQSTKKISSSLEKIIS